MPTELNAASEGTVGPIRESLRAAEKIRTLRFPDSESSPPSSVVPDLATRKGKLLGFNIATGAPEVVTMPTSFSQILIGGDATGDIYYRSATGGTARLPIGSTGQTLTVTAGLPAWTSTASVTETLTNKTLGSGTKVTLGGDATGDIYYRSATGDAARLPIGSTGQTLTVTAGLPAWTSTASVTETLTNKTLGSGTKVALGGDATGDIYYRDSGGNLTRLAAGTNGYVLTLAAGLPTWAAGGGGGGLTNWTDTVSTASPNATVPAAVLTATNAAANVDAVICPKGSGALLGQIPTGSYLGGNKRGTSAVDWQLARSAATEVAAGNYSVICGGANNTATSSFSYSVIGGGSGNTANSSYSAIAGGRSNTASGGDCAIGGGQSNTASGGYAAVIGGWSNTASGYASVASGRSNLASGQYSSAGGYNSSTRGLTGAEAFSAGMLAVQGDAQRAAYALSRSTTDATPTELTAGGGAPSSTNVIVLPNGSSYSFTGQVVARTSGGETAAWRISGTIRRGANAAATELVGTPSKTDTNATSGASAWDITIAADTTTGALSIKGTGAAAATVRWSARIDTVEIVF